MAPAHDTAVFESQSTTSVGALEPALISAEAAAATTGGPLLSVAPSPVSSINVANRGTWPARLASGLELAFGGLSLLLGMSFLAGVPILQFLGLGYLVEASRRVAVEGRLRAGLVGARKAARVGGIVLGLMLVSLPLRFVASMRRDAALIDPTSHTAQGWHTALVILSGVAAVHVTVALARGGRLRWFLIPQLNPRRIARGIFRRGGYRQARDATYDFVVGLRLPYYFGLGLRAFVAGIAWLALPVTLLVVGREAPPLGWVGAILLIWIATYIPFLQTQIAVEQRLSAGFDWRQVRRRFARAPVAHLIALLCTLLFAVPLYLLKIELVSRDAAWLPGLLFVAFIFPARVLVGWAYGRASRRDQPRLFLFRWASSLLMLVLAAAYVVIVYFSQYTAWYGMWSMYEQHAFLLPAPFLSL